MMTMPEISKHDLMAVRQFLLASREEGRFDRVHEIRPAGALQARVCGLRHRRRTAVLDACGAMGER